MVRTHDVAIHFTKIKDMEDVFHDFCHAELEHRVFHNTIRGFVWSHIHDHMDGFDRIEYEYGADTMNALMESFYIVPHWHCMTLHLYIFERVTLKKEETHMEKKNVETATCGRYPWEKPDDRKPDRIIDVKIPMKYLGNRLINLGYCSNDDDYVTKSGYMKVLDLMDILYGDDEIPDGYYLSGLFVKPRNVCMEMGKEVVCGTDEPMYTTVTVKLYDTVNVRILENRLEDLNKSYERAKEKHDEHAKLSEEYNGYMCDIVKKIKDAEDILDELKEM